MGERLPMDLESQRPRMLALARAWMPRELRRRLDPSDLVQDVLLRAYRSARQRSSGVSPEAEWAPESQDAWLRRVLRNVTLNLLREHRAERRDLRREERAPDGSASIQLLVSDRRRPSMQTPSAPLRTAEIDAQMRAAVAALPAAQREIFESRRVQGLGVSEICSRTGKTPDAVAGLLRRAQESVLRQLRDSSRDR